MPRDSNAAWFVASNRYQSPIRDSRGAYLYALGTSGAAGRMTEAKLSRVVPLMLSAARDIHAQL